jgi:protein-L-isoaspartate(D-aspartate) O-methyltransferase
MIDPLLARQNMVHDQIIARGIKDKKIIDAFIDVPRHRFVDDYLKYKAYDDYPLSIGLGQTISQPYMVALMTEALKLKPEHNVLEIGTGSGYQAAILSRLSNFVYSIERIAPLASKARRLLDELGIFNVQIIVGDGSKGYPKNAPYDRIIVTAGAPHTPDALIEQLSPDGLLVVPVGGEYLQELKRITKTKTGTKTENLGGCRFVKLIGENGWNNED